MDAEFAKYIATLGVGGILAGMMFMVYRKDVRQYTELWRQQTDLLMAVVKENTHTQTRLVDVIETLCRQMGHQFDEALDLDKRRTG